MSKIFSTLDTSISRSSDEITWPRNVIQLVNSLDFLRDVIIPAAREHTSINCFVWVLKNDSVMRDAWFGRFSEWEFICRYIWKFGDSFTVKMLSYLRVYTGFPSKTIDRLNKLREFMRVCGWRPWELRMGTGDLWLWRCQWIWSWDTVMTWNIGNASNTFPIIALSGCLIIKLRMEWEYNVMRYWVN